MAVPKRRKSISRRNSRRAQYFKKLNPPTFVLCKNCGKPTYSHRICPNCGFYKNKPIIEKK